ncbi:MAG: DEAD/DEAH box helicase [Candidatus Wallbacteria bacterium HGW-Wallbacteria-1]|jgi:ATP-dependent RNA helicase RhlE|uniref:RNA helicase n=1 Tax=Candidatus Wallbacteria bacterium HGW-Wallbacteria-1 TaxID=2013854 RepID=A0A2N1PJ40_9BACT|nr:MAG: DEAD/DEAH box helicase [Candidatus Wallbacteria bacterium HGW-Wallbacteria-1]
MKTSNFSELNLIPALLKALTDEGYERPTPIQTQAIPSLLEGRDLLGCAQTGTGKTAAFALPILQRLSATKGKHRILKALIVTPTRELAAQIDESFKTYGRHLHLRSVVIFGGVSQTHQVNDLRRGADILVATPGRLLDLIGQRLISLNALDIFVLDEADRMLDMGFINDVRKIISHLPDKRQSMFFSATMPREARDLSDRLLLNPVKVSVTPQSTPVERINQTVMFVSKENKLKLLESLLRDKAITKALVFTRTKHGANRLTKQLTQSGISCIAIHGNKTQNARTKALEGFKSGKVRILVATDIAARGIDIDSITHVINFDLPNEPESYVHRIGRTARAGNDGIAVSMCSGDERDYLDDIQKLIAAKIPLDRDHPYHCRESEAGLVNGMSAVQYRKEKAQQKALEFQKYKQARSSGARDANAPRPRGGSYSRSSGHK